MMMVVIAFDPALIVRVLEVVEIEKSAPRTMSEMVTELGGKVPLVPVIVSVYVPTGDAFGTVTFIEARPLVLADTVTRFGERSTMVPGEEEEPLRVTVVPVVPPNPFKLLTETNWVKSVVPWKTTMLLVLGTVSK